MHRIFGKFLLVSLITTFSFVGLSYVVQAESVGELQERIKDRANERAELEKQADVIRKELLTATSEKSALTAELNRINGERKSLDNTIKKTENYIETLDLKINKSEKEISRYSSEIITHSDALSGVIRGVDQYTNLSFLEVILSGQFLSDFFLLRDSYARLQKPLIDLTNELAEQKIALRTTNQLLFKEQLELHQEKDILSDQRSIIKLQEDEKVNVVSKAQQKENSYQQSLRKTMATIASLDAEIRSFESKLTFALNPESLPDKGSGVLAWPLKSVLVTQRFGRTISSERLYVSGSHSGTDFRAAVGTPVYAVADGVVRGVGDTDATCPKASFGKWVFIEHDTGLSTTSGHLSKWKVSSGQQVKKGDIIAYSGNTGRSTAPHLHLTVYATKGVDGEQGARITDRASGACAGKTYRMPLAPTSAYLDPLAYLPKTTSANFKHN
jgi:murein DD-endopeptidase MepM/ murein hydrolase activator NlpD